MLTAFTGQAFVWCCITKFMVWFAAGIAVYFVLKRFLRKNLDFLETFTHELTHTIVGLMFFQRIHSFTATNGAGGVISHSGKYSKNVFITLAPYCLPVFTFFLLIIRLIIAAKSLWIFDVLIGLTVGFHTVAMKRDIGIHQTDIQSHGVVFSYLFIWAFILFNAAIILGSIRSGIDGAFVNWWNNLVFLCKSVNL